MDRDIVMELRTLAANVREAQTVVQDNKYAHHMTIDIGDVDAELLDLVAKEIDGLRAENFTLAAGVCEYRGGNEHGNPLCLKTNIPI
jgi:hypothetical protein